jgi:hypothetical protein
MEKVAPTLTGSVNPIVEKLIKGAGGESIAILRGFVGPSVPSVTRLYCDLSLARYVDIPSASVLHTEPAKLPQLPAVIYVRSSAVVTFVEVITRSMVAGAFQRLPSPCKDQGHGAATYRRRQPGIRIGPPGGGGVCGDYARAAYYAMKEYEEARDAGDDRRASDALGEVLSLTNEAVDAGCNPWAW